MRAIITVVESRSMPDRYTIKCDALKDKRGNVPEADIRGAAAAAAQALDYAIRLGSKGFAIIAPQKVLEHIPSDMRSRL